MNYDFQYNIQVQLSIVLGLSKYYSEVQTPDGTGIVDIGWPPLIERRSKAKLAMLCNISIRTGLTLVPHEQRVINFRKPDVYVLPNSGVDANLKYQ